VNHKFTSAEMVAAGRDVERLVLARAVKLFLERRVLLNGNKTVVFR
jgi:formyltetrahydrofolate deformylase